MTRQAARIAVLALCGVSVVGQTQRPPTFRGGANFVLVDVYPTQDGRIVEGLKLEQFYFGRPGNAKTKIYDQRSPRVLRLLQ